MYQKPLVIFLFLVIGLVLKSQQITPFPIKSGEIDYVMTGGTKGKETFSFDNYGQQVRASKTISTYKNGKYYNETYILITKNDTTYTYNSTLGLYVVQLNSDLSTQVSNHLATPEMLQIMAFESIDKEEVAGFDCQKWAGQDGELWMWKGIVLKSRHAVMGVEVCIEASRFVCDPQFPSDRFTVPKKYISNQ